MCKLSQIAKGRAIKNVKLATPLRNVYHERRVKQEGTNMSQRAFGFDRRGLNLFKCCCWKGAKGIRYKREGDTEEIPEKLNWDGLSDRDDP